MAAAPEIVEKAIHFVSIDEAREPFIPTLFNSDPRVTEIWCPGIHSDIGGGYYHDGLSDNVLQLMQKAELGRACSFAISTRTLAKTVAQR